MIGIHEFSQKEQLVSLLKYLCWAVRWLFQLLNWEIQFPGILFTKGLEHEPLTVYADVPDNFFDFECPSLCYVANSSVFPGVIFSFK